MTRKQRVWAKRVSEWKASGQTSIEFCKGKDYSPSGLRYWASRFGMTRGRGEDRPSSGVRMARVVPAESKRNEGRSNEKSLLIEVGRIRVVVPRSFDPQALHEILDVLEARREQR